MVQINIHLCTLTIHECTTSNTHSQHGTLRPRLSVRRNRMLQPVLNLLLTTQTARPTKLSVSSAIQVSDRTGGRRRGKLAYMAQGQNLVCCVLCREFETKTGHGLIANCRETDVKTVHVVCVIRDPLVGSTILCG